MSEYTKIQRKARKAHACEVCGCAIYPGKEYIYVRCITGKGYSDSKRHIHCDALLCQFMKDSGKELRMDRLHEVSAWMQKKACSTCSLKGECNRMEHQLTACLRLLSCILPPTVRSAAIESASSILR